MEQEKVFQEVDVFDLIKEIGARNKTLNAKVLQELESMLKTVMSLCNLGNSSLTNKIHIREVSLDLYLGTLNSLHFHPVGK